MVMRIVQKLFAAGPGRKSRLHDAQGNRLSLERTFRNGPQALVSGLIRLTTGHLPDQPWISYDAYRLLSSRLDAKSRVLEFGSGMSTAYWAEYAGEVIAIEDNAEWHTIVEERFRRRGITNATIILKPDLANYARLTTSERGDGFDLIIVDGQVRAECARFALSCLRPGGSIYLDNSDVAPEARETLIEATKILGGSTRVFTDFAPTALFVQQGLLFTLPRP